MAGSRKPLTGAEKVKSEERQGRLADALRLNLRRRKTQKQGRDEAGDALEPLDHDSETEKK